MKLTGCAILFRDINLVVVEGGVRATRKFKRIMLHRIDWTKSVKKDSEEGEEADITNGSGTELKVNNNCFLVWQGTILKPNFQMFRFETMTSEEAVRKYMNHRWSEHYWDMVCNFKEDQSQVDDNMDVIQDGGDDE